MIGFDYFDEIQQWYIVFERKEIFKGHFIQRILKKDFCHCYLVREIAPDKVLVIDPLLWGTAVAVVDRKLEDYLLNAAQRAAAILGFTADYRRCVRYIPRGLYTCVTMCKSVLGLTTGRWALTPYRLYRHLLRYPHTTIVKPYTPYVS